MATSRKALREEVKAIYVEKLIEVFTQADMEILRTGSNEIALPVVDREGNEDFIVITVKIPTGSREDGEPYDGYAAAQAYEMKCEAKAEKAKAAAEKKAAKIAKDKAAREAKKAEAEKPTE